MTCVYTHIDWPCTLGTQGKMVNEIVRKIKWALILNNEKGWRAGGIFGEWDNHKILYESILSDICEYISHKDYVKEDVPHADIAMPILIKLAHFEKIIIDRKVHLEKYEGVLKEVVANWHADMQHVRQALIITQEISVTD